ncbi:imidazole glycerol phosphate synthase subunit HisH [Thermaerobacter sp. PB12/4term]|uniref:imidazole glycerol phosphate synthase subunit HisH n=1 Tax=Thermaerobacter sp. PB12/4term TaxID=2293838 RepID=UPI000E32602A|nr:imidazole glycerol phosphate synthase subunit HisH [Thermaerobacter sp. PB12/4term]QIA26593.1 imidazole glycerol phosphate synthase subunit HisH [Thermaerobacter sp. PB12/4term]
MAQPYVAMVDYGTGNVHSLGKALERAGCRTRLTADPDELARAAGVVLPGVGAFGPARRRLEALGLIPVLQERVAAGRPLLGICLGMQLLFEGSREDGCWPGLGLLPGWVEPFSDRRAVAGVAAAPGEAAAARDQAAPGDGAAAGGGAEASGPEAVRGAPGDRLAFKSPLKVPHMGWNRVAVPPGSRLLAGLGDTFYAYFVHSYRVPWPPAGSPVPASSPPPPAVASGPSGSAGLSPLSPAAGRRLAAGSSAAPAPASAALLLARADYGGPFVAAVEAGPVLGTQFHPEKSGPAGLRILRNFGAMCGACDPSP